MHYSIEVCEAKHVAGLSAVTSNQLEMSGQGVIGSMWNRFWSPEHQNIVNPWMLQSPIIALYSDYTAGVNGPYQFTLGFDVTHTNEPYPANWVEKRIPTAKYIKFETAQGRMQDVVVQAWQYIWKWFEEHSYERTYTGDFELYDKRCSDSEQAVVDIYVAIK